MPVYCVIRQIKTLIESILTTLISTWKLDWKVCWTSLLPPLEILGLNFLCVIQYNPSTRVEFSQKLSAGWTTWHLLLWNTSKRTIKTKKKKKNSTSAATVWRNVWHKAAIIALSAFATLHSLSYRSVSVLSAFPINHFYAPGGRFIRWGCWLEMRFICG